MCRGIIRYYHATEFFTQSWVTPSIVLAHYLLSMWRLDGWVEKQDAVSMITRTNKRIYCPYCCTIATFYFFQTSSITSPCIFSSIIGSILQKNEWCLETLLMSHLLTPSSDQVPGILIERF